MGSSYSKQLRSTFTVRRYQTNYSDSGLYGRRRVWDRIPVWCFLAVTICKLSLLHIQRYFFTHLLDSTPDRLYSRVISLGWIRFQILVVSYIKDNSLNLVSLT